MLLVVMVFFLAVAYMVLGVITGTVVGRRLGGKAGAACLGAALDLPPVLMAYFAFQWFFRW